MVKVALLGGEKLCVYPRGRMSLWGGFSESASLLLSSLEECAPLCPSFPRLPTSLSLGAVPVWSPGGTETVMDSCSGRFQALPSFFFFFNKDTAFQ